MRYRLLGPLQVRGDMQSANFGGPRRERLVAALLLQPNQVTTLDYLVEVIWGHQPPPSALKQVRNSVSAIKTAFRQAGVEAEVRTSRAGYQMVVEESDVDVAVFDSMVQCGRQFRSEGCAETAVVEFARALSLWRGPALAGIESSALRPMVSALEERRMSACEQHAEAALEAGQHNQIVAHLTALVTAHPLRERLVAYLMLALYRSGRRAEALATFRELRRRLVHEMGVEPARGLADLHVRMLRGQSPSGSIQFAPSAAAVVVNSVGADLL